MFSMCLVSGYEDLKNSRKSEAHDDGTEEIMAQASFGKGWSDLPKMLLLLLKNPTFIFLCLGGTTEYLAVGGLATFGSKLIQQFHNLDLITAGAIMGFVSIPGSGGGMLLGGYLVKKFQLKCRGILKLCSACAFICMLLGPSFLAFCSDSEMAGVSGRYLSETWSGLESPCNIKCGCSTRGYEPVCDSQKISYFSPCHAGCHRIYTENSTKSENMFFVCILHSCLYFTKRHTLFLHLQMFYDCSCVNTTYTAINTRVPVEVTSGSCNERCVMLYPFCVLLGLMMFFTFTNMSPTATACFSVDITRTFPGPIILGAIIDVACDVWQQTDCGVTGSCWIYRKHDLAIYLICWWMCMKCLGSMFYFIASRVYKAPKDLDEKVNPNHKMNVSTIENGFIVNGIINVILPALEKRYALSSSRSGFIASGNDIGALVVLLFVGYFGERRHKPKIMAAGIFFMCFGCLLFALPQFIGDKYSYVLSGQTQNLTVVSENLCSPVSTNNTILCDSNTEQTVKDSNNGYYVMFVIGQILLGFGAVPMFTIGLTYIDENCKAKMTSFHISLTFCMAAIGVSIGFIIGGQTLGFFVDADKIDTSSVPLTPMDPQWVGAWWIGILIALVGLLISALPISGYPKRLPGLATFGSKLIQQFHNVDLIRAGAIMGFVSIPGSGGGMLFGGYIVKKLKLKCRGIIRLCSACAFICMLLGPSFLAFCPDGNMAGISGDYLSERDLILPVIKTVVVLLKALNRFVTVRGKVISHHVMQDAIAYYTSNTTKMFYDCSCVNTTYSTIDIGVPVQITSGSCTEECNLLYLFCVMLTLMMFFTFTNMSPTVTACFRCVPHKQRSFALAVQLIVLRTLATMEAIVPVNVKNVKNRIQIRINYNVTKFHVICPYSEDNYKFLFIGTFPGPIILGSIIDKACDVWQLTDCGVTGSCWIYRKHNLAIYLICWWMCMKFLGSMFYYIASRKLCANNFFLYGITFKYLNVLSVSGISVLKTKFTLKQLIMTSN
ncbi:hypothetical protein KUTeg_014085 [Tegillarca granosa]|uniref:Kazal-like domain-containing protein n=1 Tax=Tegillarca granosa TaxID=220873 RepID=A0ABQ9EY37_TEGGR|nr:hypothetical protein KUTeg_014085 [Tegillarca granosa]